MLKKMLGFSRGDSVDDHNMNEDTVWFVAVIEIVVLTQFLI